MHNVVCCIFSNWHTSGTDELEVAERIKKKCELLLTCYVWRTCCYSLLEIRMRCRCNSSVLCEGCCSCVVL